MPAGEDTGTEQTEKTATSLSRLQWWAYSVPLFMKTLGMVVLVSAIFGGVVYFQVHAKISLAHDEMHIESADRVAVSIARSLEHLDLVNDTPLVERAISGTVDIFPDVSYILVFDAAGKLLAHRFNFPVEAPPQLPAEGEELCATCHDLPEVSDIPAGEFAMATGSQSQGSRAHRYSRSTGTILEAEAPILGGEGGSVRVGHSDSSIGREMNTIKSAVTRSLIICLVMGQGLALLLTYLLVHPILNLVQAANEIGAGDFAWRAKVYSSDEIGRLARAFNLMAGKLQDYEKEVQEKETFRVSLMDRIVQAQEEERVSVARELHDQLGQSLYRIFLSYEDIRRDGVVEDPRFDELQGAIREVIDDVRRLAWELRPSVLDDFGLDSALKQYVQETSSRTGLPIDFRCAFPPDSMRLPSHTEVILYRVAQEAITNVVRHAEARRASVILLRDDSVVTLLVEDDGQGFDAGALSEDSMSSLGLMGMKERVSLAGGSLTIDSQPGKGATIRAKIPITEGV